MKKIPTITCLDSALGQNWAMYQGDCVPVTRQIPDNSVDLEVFSPPFANVYTYSDSAHDMGNVDDEAEFIQGYQHIARELFRILRPGRICAVHCKQTVKYKGSYGRAGWHDFRGDLIRAHHAAGFMYAGEVVLWTDPVIEQRKTNCQRLLYVQLRKDSTLSTVGIPEYVLYFRKWPKTDDDPRISPVSHKRSEFPLDQWQRWASPVWDGENLLADRLGKTSKEAEYWIQRAVWMDVNHKETLNVQAARENGDEKHMCPLSLDVIRRVVTMYSNPGDVVFSPFGGVASEGVGALRLGRRYVGIELKGSYFHRACRNLAAEEGIEQVSMFG